jgi:hypothetical protein
LFENVDNSKCSNNTISINGNSTEGSNIGSFFKDLNVATSKRTETL